MERRIKETELYAPVKDFFVSQGYTVNGEVNGCDIAAVKDGRLVIVELKTSFSLKLMYQALDRQRLTDEVYVCVPRPLRHGKAFRRGPLALAKRCGLGFITVALDSPSKAVEVLAEPGGGEVRVKKAARKGVLAEIAGRSCDVNSGGTRGVKINTAYRERAVKIACVLEKNGPLTAGELVNLYGCEKDAYSILYRNYYGWFERVAPGVYALTEKGAAELYDPALAPMAGYYRAELNKV